MFSQNNLAPKGLKDKHTVTRWQTLIWVRSWSADFSGVFRNVNSRINYCGSKWRYRTGSTLVQIMACCLMALSHCMYQYWLTISETSWHLAEGKFTTTKKTVSLTTQCFKTTYSEILLHLTGANELTKQNCWVNRTFRWYLQKPRSPHWPNCPTCRT